MTTTRSLPNGYQCLALRTPTLPPVEHTNCYIIGHHAALVVDPGSPYPGEVEKLMRRIHRLRGTGGNISAVILTHHHRDHIGAAEQLASRLGVAVLAHTQTLDRVDLGPVLRRSVAEGDTLDAEGDLTLKVLWTPGHAHGHICLFEPRRRTLLAGDMVPGVGTTLIDPDEGDMGVYLAQLSRLAELDPLTILPAHGPAISKGRSAIDQLIKHRLQREAQVLAAVVGGHRELTDIMRAAYPELSPVFWGLASRSTLAHLRKLERENRVRQSQHDRWCPA